MHLVGEMFCEMVEGMMSLLRSRAELKSQFRMSVTTIRAAENNPLKFSMSVGEAMQALLKPDRKGFLKPVDAIQNGFDDISNHQLAMTAGIQASVSDLLKKFNPQRFESQVDRSVFGTKNIKCWNNYSESYEQNATDAMEDFFGDAFVAAYEQQMRVLESINGPG